MSFRGTMFAAVLIIAAALISAGVATIYPAAGIICAGILLAVWGWLVFRETS